jgi:hypothetical protein
MQNPSLILNRRARKSPLLFLSLATKLKRKEIYRMNISNKEKWILKAMIAGIMLLGMAHFMQANAADDSDNAQATETATPTLKPTQPAVVWSGVIQAQDNWTNNGNAEALSLAHVRVRGVIVLDSENSLAIMPDYAIGTFTLLDAYGVHKFGYINGLSVMAGQFKYAFGDNRYLLPQQLKRTTYNITDALIPGNATAKAWDLGLEVKEQIDALTVQVDAIQGDGPNVTADPNNTIDFTARAEWKDTHFILGISNYYGKGGQTAAYTFTSLQDWFDAYGRLMIESLDFRTEMILAPNNASGFDAQLSIKPISWFEPLVWFETMNNANSGVVNNLGVPGIANSLGAGVNFWSGDKTRVSFDLSFIGTSDILNTTSETLQVEETF